MKPIKPSRRNMIIKSLAIPAVLLFVIGISGFAGNGDELLRARQAGNGKGTSVAKFLGDGMKEVISYKDGVGSDRLKSEVRTLSRQNSAAAQTAQDKTGIDKSQLAFKSIETPNGVAATFTNATPVDLKSKPNLDEADAVRIQPGKLAGVVTPKGDVSLYIKTNEIGSFRDYSNLKMLPSAEYRQQIINDDRAVAKGVLNDKSYASVPYLKLTPIPGSFIVEPINPKSVDYKILNQIPPQPAR